MRFFEDGAQTHQLLATVGAGRGSVPFSPGIGPAGERQIVAVTSEHGVPVAHQLVAWYAASGTQPARAPRGLFARRRGTALLVRWRRDPGSLRGYQVHLTVKDGASRIIYVPAASTTAVFKAALEPTDTATVTVQGIAADGRLGAVARLAVPKTRR